ncbi:calcium-dependent secretion activator 2-like [Hydractinia symbiolongicarpus]|uniref:calcium-dependent secretion activator 2-like n=1 Tax=Hydractinia symbiolongicarpus TaxID=13093 RepID=UPI00254F31E5|nr:calcium-dependent secretion activator 2-like [Hydractinia symbiolongicarpus]
MNVEKGASCDVEVNVLVSIEMTKPDTIKKCGFLYAQSKKRWKKWKERFFMLAQVSGFQMVLCTFNTNSSIPYEWMIIEGYTVDYADNSANLPGGRFFFRLTNVNDVVLFACEEDQDLLNWIFKLYVATGQTYKPEISAKGMSTTPNDDTNLQKTKRDMDRAFKHGFGDIVQADPLHFNHVDMFATLHKATLIHRLNDAYVSRGRLTTDQTAVLNEYCARYGVNPIHQYLILVNNLLESAENDGMMDVKIIGENYWSLRKFNLDTEELEQRLEELTYRLEDYLCKQIINFKKNFPYGQPKNALKSTISLLEEVLSTHKDERKDTIDVCIRKSALVNYIQLTDNLRMQDSVLYNMSHEERMNKAYDLSTRCVDEVEDIRSYYPEVLSSTNGEHRNYANSFLLLLTVDLDIIKLKQPYSFFNGLQVFKLLNSYSLSHVSLRQGTFHKYILKMFSPLIISYMDVTEELIINDFYDNVTKESYGEYIEETPFLQTFEDLHNALLGMQEFTLSLQWPYGLFADHITTRTKFFSADMMEKFVEILHQEISSIIKHMKGTLSFVLPSKCCSLVNVLIEAYQKVGALCPSSQYYENETSCSLYHKNIFKYILDIQDEIIDMIKCKFQNVINSLLKSLCKFDQGTWYFAVTCKGRNMDDAENYFEFLAMNIRQFKHEIKNDNFRYLLKMAIWKNLCTMINDWLDDRHEEPLHATPLKVLHDILQSCRSLFEEHDFSVTALESSEYNKASKRIQVEIVMQKMHQDDEMDVDEK